jgi:hypothetical protein
MDARGGGRVTKGAMVAATCSAARYGGEVLRFLSMLGGLKQLSSRKGGGWGGKGGRTAVYQALQLVEFQLKQHVNS